jgi:predicted RNase H-like HicB family nuclease
VGDGRLAGGDGAIGQLCKVPGENEMNTVEYTYWRDGDIFLGFLNDHPDYWTQGETKLELIENLKGILEDVASGEVPFVRTVEELMVA